jgi:hypothetical protein
MKKFLCPIKEKNKHMSDFRCESQDLSLERFVIDDNECLQLL